MKTIEITNGWKDPKKELPEIGQPVLVLCNIFEEDFYTVAKYVVGVGWECISNHCISNETVNIEETVILWMHIPALPYKLEVEEEKET